MKLFIIIPALQTNFLQPDDYTTSLKITGNKLERTGRAWEVQFLENHLATLTSQSSSSLQLPHPVLL